MPARSRSAPFLSICDLARMTMPGMQNPHCRPPHAANASAKRCRSSGVDALERDDGLAGDLLEPQVAADDGLAVDHHRAAPALARRRAAVLGRRDVELLAQRGEQVRVIAADRHRRAVERELGASSLYILSNERAAPLKKRLMPVSDDRLASSRLSVRSARSGRC